MAGASTIGFGTTSFNVANFPALDVTYFSPSDTANLKARATLNYAEDFGTILAVQAENYADVSSSDLDAAIGNSIAGIDKEVIMVVNTAAGAAPTAGVAIITVEYLQSVNSVRNN
jgi:glutathione peroxidase-family protein